ncbi:MAG: response regulator transcription factor [Methylococcales bacterium]
MRILIAQDDSNVASKVKLGLLAEGYDVDITGDGETTLWYANEGNHSVIILDILLPKINGFDVCQMMRDNGITTPILMLTNKATIEDEIDSLETGADDFLRIPFSTPVFIARVRALLRRRNREIIDTINFGSLCYKPKDRKCIFDEHEISLTSREGKVLELLMLAGGEVVPKQTLINQVWGMEFSGDPNIVDVYIGYLRRKICGSYDNKAHCNNNVLQNVRGVGYRLSLGR